MLSQNNPDQDATPTAGAVFGLTTTTATRDEDGWESCREKRLTIVAAAVAENCKFHKAKSND